MSVAVFPTKVYEESNFKDEKDTTDLIIPYQVRIEAVYNGNTTLGECFGTLISKRHVLTARKCVYHGVTNFNVYVKYNTTKEKVSTSFPKITKN